MKRETLITWLLSVKVSLSGNYLHDQALPEILPLPAKSGRTWPLIDYKRPKESVFQMRLYGYFCKRFLIEDNRFWSQLKIPFLSFVYLKSYGLPSFFLCRIEDLFVKQHVSLDPPIFGNSDSNFNLLLLLHIHGYFIGSFDLKDLGV